MLFYERDSVLSDQRNDGQGDQWNDVVFRHPELDSGSQGVCYFTSEIPY